MSLVWAFPLSNVIDYSYDLQRYTSSNYSETQNQATLIFVNRYVKLQRESGTIKSRNKSEAIHETVGTYETHNAEPNVYSRTPNTATNTQENPAYV